MNEGEDDCKCRRVCQHACLGRTERWGFQLLRVFQQAGVHAKCACSFAGSREEEEELPPCPSKGPCHRRMFFYAGWNVTGRLNVSISDGALLLWLSYAKAVDAYRTLASFCEAENFCSRLIMERRRWVMSSGRRLSIPTRTC
jgi:hypothetical protein